MSFVVAPNVRPKSLRQRGSISSHPALADRPASCYKGAASHGGGAGGFSHAPSQGRAQHLGNQDLGDRRSGRQRALRRFQRDRFPRSHAGAAVAPQPDGHHPQGRRRPAHRLPPHHRGYRDRPGPGGRPGARRPQGHRALRRRANSDGRDPHPGGAGPLQPTLSGVEGELHPRQAGRDGYRSVQGVVPCLRPERRDDAARGKPLRHQQPPHHRVLLQGPRPRPAPGGRDRSAQSGRGAVDQGQALKRAARP